MLHAESRQTSDPVAKGSLRKSLFLHVAVLGFVVAMPYLHTPPKVIEPPTIQAVLIRKAVVHAPEAKPVEPPPVPPSPPEPPKQLDLPEPVKEPPKIALPKPPEKPAPKVAEKKPAPLKPLIKPPTLNAAKLDAEMKAMEREMQEAEMQRLRAEADKAAAAIRVSANMAMVDRYKGLINQRVQTKWNRPLSARNGMVVTLRISMLPGGEVTNVVSVNSSGDAAFDASAEEAVRRASPLPVPEDPGVFNQYFRMVTLKFNPEDL